MAYNIYVQPLYDGHANNFFYFQLPQVSYMINVVRRMPPDTLLRRADFQVDCNMEVRHVC